MSQNLPAILDHELNKWFPELLNFESTRDLKNSALWRMIKPEVDRILEAVVQENFASGGVELGLSQQTLPVTDRKSETREPGSEIANLKSEIGRPAGPIRALAWNIERGIQFDGILDALRHHPDLNDRDFLLLTELDYGMARSGNRFVARDLALALNLNYAFAPVYIALQKGSGVEINAAGVNEKSLHGLALLSRFPLENVHAVALPNGKDKMLGSEKRLGHLRALVADVKHPSATFRAVSLHLDAHSSRAHRRRQMKIVLDHLEKLPVLPTIIGGDWNTTTYNSQNATRAILGYWRRVMMGVKNVAANHLPHPDRYFERGLFSELESRGYDYRSFNNLGTGTLHYDIESVEKNTNLRDWVPEWCFPFIFWAARRVGGRVSARLDWFAGYGIKPAAPPKTIADLVSPEGVPLSDHDAITTDFAATIL
jgi:endonuclease/exonuclease/phosphatase family metal-dependent hydrolase